MNRKPFVISLAGALCALAAMAAVAVPKPDVAPPGGYTNYKRVQ